MRSFSSFDFLWIAHFTSTLGERLSYVALLILAGELTTVPFGSTVVMSIYTLIFVFASPFAGSLVDSFNKKKILIWTDILRGILVLGYILAISFDSNRLSSILLFVLVTTVVFISGIARTGFWSIIPDSVPKEKIADLNARITTNTDIALAIGTAVGGWLLERTSYISIFIVDSITYFYQHYCLLVLFTEYL